MTHDFGISLCETVVADGNPLLSGSIKYVEEAIPVGIRNTIISII